MTHAELVASACQWLKRSNDVVITDMKSDASETPDAIGWKSGVSTLVECKASVSDFKADQRKYFRRRVEYGMGVYRYYMTPAGLLSKDDVPENWGLVEITGSKYKVKRASCIFRPDNYEEQRLLTSALRRVCHNAPDGVNVRCYTHRQNTCVATMSVAQMEMEF
jgi:hypothetical protein